MKRILIGCLILITVAAMAQQSKSPVASAVREILARQQKNLIAAVDEMPADKFNFKPTPQQMNFGHLVLHITGSNNHLCSALSETAVPKQPELKETDGKDKLMAALKASFDFCTTVLEKMDDSKLGDKIELFGHEGTKAFALIALTNDWADHYGAAAMYLRLNGLLPPTAKK